MTKADRDWLDRAVAYTLRTNTGGEGAPLTPYPCSWVADYIACDVDRNVLARAVGACSEALQSVLLLYGCDSGRFLASVRSSLGRLVKKGLAHEMRGVNRGRECAAWIWKEYDQA